MTYNMLNGMLNPTIPYVYHFAYVSSFH